MFSAGHVWTAGHKTSEADNAQLIINFIQVVNSNECSLSQDSIRLALIARPM